MKGERLFEIVASGGRFDTIVKELKRYDTVRLDGVSGSFISVAAAAVAGFMGGIHVFIAEDKDAASYMCTDLYNFLDPERVLLFPTAYKRSIQFHSEDPAGIVQRTTALNAMRNHKDGYLFVCTYPEAVAEKVVDRERLSRSTLHIAVGKQIQIEKLAESLDEYMFEKVDFVYEPGQYSVRGGIVDIFSFSDNQPYRVDFFGDEVESIRHFEIGSQLSVDRLNEIEIVPNLKNLELVSKRISFASFASGATYWMTDPEYTFKKLDSIRTKMLKEIEEPSQIDTLVTSRKAFLEDTAGSKYIVLSDNAKDRVADTSVVMSSAPQP